jgi:hypothetical protein
MELAWWSPNPSKSPVYRLCACLATQLRSTEDSDHRAMHQVDEGLLSRICAMLRKEHTWMIGGSNPGRGCESFSSRPCPDRFWVPPSLLSTGHKGLLPWGVKRVGREADRSSPSSAEAKNVWSYTSTP